MNKREEINQKIKYLEECVEYFSSKKKADREYWIVNEFLTNLNIKFDCVEIQKGKTEPVNVIFRRANFQTKEILDEDSKRHGEYKEALKKLKESPVSFGASELKAIPRYISIQKIVNLINEKLESYIVDTVLCKQIDMLLYVNLSVFGLSKNIQYIFPERKIWQKWRSVSMVENGRINFVFWDREDAPDFIKSNIGRIICREGKME